MKDFILLFSLILILGSRIGLVPSSATGTNPNNSGAKSDAHCSSSSEIAKLLCFANRNIDGLNNAFLNFNKEKVVAVTSYDYYCDLGIFYEFQLKNVKGYIVEIIYDGVSMLYYINLVGLKGITFIPPSGQFYIRTGGLDKVLPDTVVPLSLAYLAFKVMTGNDYHAECNKFTQVTDNCASSCPSKRPVAIVSLAACQTLFVGYLDKVKGNDTGAGVYANAYGLSCVECKKQGAPEAGSNPPLSLEVCRTNKNENGSCNYRGPSYNFEIKKNYCNETLNNDKIREVARSYGKAYPRNEKRNSFLSLLFFPQLYAEPMLAFSNTSTRDATSYFELRGLIGGNFQYRIMKPLMSIR